jgi:3-oxoacyl-[acyl-carrier-protein] synthase III
MTKKDIYISGFSYEVGENEYSIERLRTFRNYPEQLSKFKDAGFSKFRTSNNTIFSLAEKAIKKLFEKIDTRPDDIDAIIFSTSSLGAIDNISNTKLCEFLLKNHLNNAFPLVSSFSFCGNFLTSIQKGFNYIKSDEYNNILVVTTDVISPESTRIAPPDIAIGSDGAAACLLSSKKKSPFKVKKIVQTVDVSSGMLDPDKDFLKYTNAVGKSIRSISTKIFSENDESRTKIRQVFTNNYGRNICKSYLKLINIDTEKVYLENIERFGHVCASDICINLCDYVESENNLNDGQELFVLSTGPFMWGGMLISTF